MTLAPTPPFNSLTALTVAFASWSDPSAPLSYAILVDSVVVSAQGAPASRNFTGPSAPGVHTLTGRIYDALGNFSDVTQNFTVNSPSESWRLAWFGTATNIGNAADLAEPDKDGIANLLKYALSINPGSAGNAALPRAQKSVYAEGSRLALVFTRDLTRNDISIYVEVADSPAAFQSSSIVLASSIYGAAMSGPGLVGETNIANGKKSVEVRDLVNISGTLRRFMRLRVTR